MQTYNTSHYFHKTNIQKQKFHSGMCSTPVMKFPQLKRSLTPSLVEIDSGTPVAAINWRTMLVERASFSSKGTIVRDEPRRTVRGTADRDTEKKFVGTSACDTHQALPMKWRGRCIFLIGNWPGSRKEWHACDRYRASMRPDTRSSFRTGNIRFAFNRFDTERRTGHAITIAH